MPDSGSGLFTDAEEYRASLPIRAELLVLHPSQFSARLTTVKLPNLRLVRAWERTPRIAFLCLPPDDLVLSFSTARSAPLTYSGLELGPGDLVLHRGGECFHQRTSHEGVWGLIATSPAFLSSSSKVLLGRRLAGPRKAQIVTPKPSDHALLLRLHAQAGRVAETSLARLGHPQVIRALESEVSVALVTCLGNCEVHRVRQSLQDEADLVAGLERTLSDHCGMRTELELATALGTSKASLRRASVRVLSMDPEQYQRLRFLRTVHLAMLHAKTSGAPLLNVARRYGFTDLEHFGEAYRGSYGEESNALDSDSA